jgi:predicted peroxiredoxin
MSRAAISLTTGLEDAERVTVALLVALGAAEGGRDTAIFLTKEAVRLAVDGFAVGTACEGCPPIPELMARYAAAEGTLLVCPICFTARHLDDTTLVPHSQLGGTVQLWEWIGEGAITFSF